MDADGHALSILALGDAVFGPIRHGGPAGAVPTVHAFEAVGFGQRAVEVRRTSTGGHTKGHADGEGDQEGQHPHQDARHGSPIAHIRTDTSRRSTRRHTTPAITPMAAQNKDRHHRRLHGAPITEINAQSNLPRYAISSASPSLPFSLSMFATP